MDQPDMKFKTEEEATKWLREEINNSPFYGVIKLETYNPRGSYGGGHGGNSRRYVHTAHDVDFGIVVVRPKALYNRRRNFPEVWARISSYVRATYVVADETWENTLAVKQRRIPVAEVGGRPVFIGDILYSDGHPLRVLGMDHEGYICADNGKYPTSEDPSLGVASWFNKPERMYWKD